MKRYYKRLEDWCTARSHADEKIALQEVHSLIRKKVDDLDEIYKLRNSNADTEVIESKEEDLFDRFLAELDINGELQAGDYLLTCREEFVDDLLHYCGRTVDDEDIENIDSLADAYDYKKIAPLKFENNDFTIELLLDGYGNGAEVTATKS